MTAEVGILNKMGVALAADSAVTFDDNTRQKVYNSANKLFSLSKYHPVGIMIYGGANYMGVPWETIIKEFRQQLGTDKEECLSTYCDRFLEFIKSDSRLYSLEAEKLIAQNTFYEKLNKILSLANLKIEEFITNNGRPSNEMIEEWVKDETITELELLNEEPFVEGLEDKYQEYIGLFSEGVKEVVKHEIPFEISPYLMDLFLNLGYNSLAKEFFTNSSSGVVFSGYGESELFPALFEYKIEGKVLGQIKLKLNDHVKIGTFENQEHGIYTSAIKPFAQREMVISFLNGMEPSLFNYIFESLGKIMNAIPLILKDDVLPNISDEEINKIRDVGNQLVELFFREITNTQFEKFINPIYDIVKILPKEELAAMAEALVNLTSFKRKVSIATETVGGPIDVAVITKGDGFIWIKRKHYFNPELNYNFFKNYLRGDTNDSSFNG